MPTLTVCPRCRDTCPKCHTNVNPAQAHGIWACFECNKRIGSKCCVCGGNKNGPGSIGAGKVCRNCYKMNKCVFCGAKI